MQDSEIVRLYFDRDQQAITCTDQKYGKYCHAIAWNILASREDSEECVNDAYLDTWNAIPPTRPFSLKAFVGRITRNRALNRYELQNAAKRGNGETALCLDELAECVSGEDELAQREDYRNLVECINGFLAEQSHEQRVIFVRRYWYGKSTADIAAEYGLGESKVKVTLSRLRKKLRTHLEKEGIRV